MNAPCVYINNTAGEIHSSTNTINTDTHACQTWTMHKPKPNCYDQQSQLIYWFLKEQPCFFKLPSTHFLITIIYFLSDITMSDLVCSCLGCNGRIYCFILYEAHNCLTLFHTDWCYIMMQEYGTWHCIGLNNTNVYCLVFQYNIITQIYKTGTLVITVFCNSYAVKHHHWPFCHPA